jgi:hypothetical protein
MADISQDVGVAPRFAATPVPVKTKPREEGEPSQMLR